MTVLQRPAWSDWYLDIATTVAKRGDCRRSRVGSVLVRPDHTVASVGFNGAEPGGPSCLAGECPRGLQDYGSLPAGGSYENCIALHSELNCLAFAREDTTGYDLYVTRSPCEGCVKVAKAHRLARIVWPDGELELN